MPVSSPKERVQSYWEKTPCGMGYATEAAGSPAFYAEVDQRRERLEPFIADFARPAETSGQRVLEVGVGIGSDFLRFVRAGAVATGIDLTEHAVQLVERRLALEGLSAALVRADAENLPFADDTFDVGYSWGVLHHTPETERAVRELIRVTRPGGRLCVMLYSRHSWVSYGLWARYGLARGRPWRSLSSILASHMESAGTRGFTKSELRAMFAGVEGLQIDKVATPYDARVAGPLARLTGAQLGWFSVIRGTVSR